MRQEVVQLVRLSANPFNELSTASQKQIKIRLTCKDEGLRSGIRAHIQELAYFNSFVLFYVL